MRSLRTVLACCFVLLLLLGLGRSNEAADKKVAAGKAPRKVKALKQLTLDLGKGVTMKLALLPAGDFMMGSKLPVDQAVEIYKGRRAHYISEHPRHKVTISKPFHMGIHEVTQAQYRAVMGAETWTQEAKTKSGEKIEAKRVDKVKTKSGDTCAASWMTWYEAEEFCKKLSKKTGKKVVIPTEAQWEYACRARSETVFCFGDDKSKLGEYCWYSENTSKTGETYAHPVGRKKPNAWGLYDMHGNVWEYCRDHYGKDFYAEKNKVDPVNTTESKGKTRSVRGGSWYNGPVHLRSAARNSWTGSTYRHYNYGFRVAIEQ